MEQTLIIVKPHAFERNLSGEFLTRFERMGLKIGDIKTFVGSSDLWEKFYPSDDGWLGNVGGKTLEDCVTQGIDVKERLGTNDPKEIGLKVKSWLVEHMSSATSLAAILAGNEAGKKVRLACGKTLPNFAAPGTIRFDYSSDSPSLANEEKRPVYNLIHASDPEEFRDGVASATYEIGLIFP